MEPVAMNVSPSQWSACQALVYSLLQRFEFHPTGEGVALALVSANPGAGVSHIQRLIREMLNENEADCAIDIDCDALGLSNELRSKVARMRSSDFKGTSGDEVRLARRFRLARYRDRVGHLDELREAYRYVLLDCHSLKERTDVLGLAPVIDGAILVVECNRTTTSQLDELERSIERYGGTILGTVLNKTTYAVPNWMNSLMERVGI